MSVTLTAHAAVFSPRAPRPRAAVELYCPFSPAVNPAAAQAQAESLRWVSGLALVPGHERARKLDRAKIGWLPARAFPSAPPELLQLAVDWTTLFCLLDDHIDVMAVSATLMATSDYLSRLLEAFKRGAASCDEPFDRAFADLSARLRAAAPAEWVRRFATSLEILFGGYVWEAINYWRRIKPSVEAYCSMRELTIGLYPQFLLGELLGHLRLSEATHAHPAVRRLRIGASRCVGWANDLFTYEKERESGEIHNLVLLLSDSCPIDHAVRTVTELHDAQVRSFLDDEAALPLFGEVGDDARRYVAMLRCWIRGHLDWARETGRYRPQGTAQP